MYRAETKKAIPAKPIPQQKSASGPENSTDGHQVQAQEEKKINKGRKPAHFMTETVRVVIKASHHLPPLSSSTGAPATMPSAVLVETRAMTVRIAWCNNQLLGGSSAVDLSSFLQLSLRLQRQQ